MTDKQRQAFEEWKVAQSPFTVTERDPDAAIYRLVDRVAEAAWTASRKLALEEAAQKVEAMCAWTGGHGEPSQPSGSQIAAAIRQQQEGQKA